MASYERVLVSFKSYLGDAVMASPILPALESQFSSVTCLTMGVVDQILQNPTAKRTFIRAKKVRKPNEVFEEAQRLRQEQFQVAVLVNHSFRSALTAVLAGIKVRVGHSQEYRGALLSHPVPYGQNDYETQSCFDLLDKVRIPYEFAHPLLSVSEQEFASVRELVGGATVGVQPGARFGQKQIPIETSASIANQLHRQGQRVALLGGPDEQKFLADFLDKLEFEPINLVGKTSIRETLAALKHLKVMIGSDTGLMHMAAGVNCPTVTVFGPTPHLKWGHRYHPHTVLASPDGLIASVPAEKILEAAIPHLEM